MSLETQDNRPAEEQEREIFFLSRSPVVRTLRRKPGLEEVFGFGEVRRVGQQVPREPETIGVVLERTFVHNVMGSQ
jgi:hypothetical protein